MRPGVRIRLGMYSKISIAAGYNIIKAYYISQRGIANR